MGDWIEAIPSILAGDVVTGDDWKQILDLLTALTCAETAYTPTWTSSGTQPVLGNGSLTGGYTRLGATGPVFFRATLVAGSSTTFGTGNWSLTLPDSPAQPAFMDFNWAGLVTDSGTATYPLHGMFVGPNTVLLTTGSPVAGVTATSPMTWTTNDRAFVSGWYWSA